jgi:hypothetical protein
MSVKYNNLKFFVLVSNQQKLLQNGINQYIKQENQKRAIVSFKQKPSSIVVYKPIIHNITHNFRSFPNTA